MSQTGHGKVFHMATNEKVLGSELKRLLSDFSDHGKLHLTEVEADLVQTTALLTEAIEKLNASFMAIHTSVCAQQQAIDSLLAEAGANPEASERLDIAKGDIARHVNAAVTGLQFQDMTSQLVGRTIKRIHGMRDVLVSLGANCDAVSTARTPEEVALRLAAMSQILEAESAKLESGLWKAVHQTHMESGDIELF